MTRFSTVRLRLLGSALALTGALTAAACTTVLRDETAERIARPSNMSKVFLPEGQFVVTSFERVDNPGGTADIYIEGDGKAWLSRSEPSLDPTPINPVALDLSSRDDAPNVIYLARPCQYAGLSNGKACPSTYWTSQRFAPEIIAAESAALDDLKARHQLTGFNLVGYSGGAAVAVLLAAQRTDVLSIRTVAGNLDPALFNRLHQVSPLAPGSADPMSVATRVANIPQHHFIGAHDDVVPSTIYDSFRRAVGPSTCIRAGAVADATHEAGWVNKWPELLKAPLDCSASN